MLYQLEIKDFAIIEHALVDFAEGFHVLTGETGAGKSIILDALSCLIGDRASKSLIRKGSQKAYLKAVFSASEHLLFKLGEQNITVSDDVVTIERELMQNGKSFVKINGSLVTTLTLREVCSEIIEICGQREHQELLKDSTYISMIDSSLEEAAQKSLVRYNECFLEYNDLKKQIESLSSDIREREQLLDLYRFQLSEIDRADLSIGEEEILDDERKFLGSYEKIAKYVAQTQQLLEPLSDMSGASKPLSQAGKYNDHLLSLSERLEKAFYEIDDISSELAGYFDSIEYDEERLNEVIGRLDFIGNLKRKYADDIEGILLYREEIFEKVNVIENRDEILSKLESRLQTLSHEMDGHCDILHKSRQSEALKKEERIATELRELCMPEAKISFLIEKTESFNAYGRDKVSLYFCANRGEDLKPIAKIASGGELSRVLLAFKIAMQNDNRVSTLIFDEVDEGIGGEVGRHIGLKLRELSKRVQVVAISHLPQVASKADHHFVISKSIKDERTVSNIQTLDNDARKYEIARMIYGDAVDDITLEQANVMLTS